MSRLLIGSWAKIRSPSGIYLTRRLYDIYFSLNVWQSPSEKLLYISDFIIGIDAFLLLFRSVYFS